jgi:hypothetical protein
MLSRGGEQFCCNANEKIRTKIIALDFQILEQPR